MKLLGLLALAVGAAAAPMGLAIHAPNMAAIFGISRPAPPALLGTRFTNIPTEPAPAPTPETAAAPEVYKERFEMPWFEKNGVRLRVTYLEAYGETLGDSKGYRLVVPGRPDRNFSAAVPAPLMRSLPIFFIGELVYYEIEVQNAGAETLRDLRVHARQESFQASGRKGEPIGYRPMPTRISALAAGETTVIRRYFRLPETARGEGPVHFDQTHVSIDASSGDGYETLLDAPHAGIVDPPAL